MSIAFSIIHGCAVSALSYSTVLIGSRLGSYGNGLMSLSFTLSALLCGSQLSAIYGSKIGLITGSIGFIFYLFGFLMSYLYPSIAWQLFMISSSIAGIGAGIVWIAQGNYFTQNALYYARESRQTATDINSHFATIFTIFYLGFEAVMSFCATVIYLFIESLNIHIFIKNPIQNDTKIIILFVFYIIIASFSMILLLSIKTVDHYHHKNNNVDLVAEELQMVEEEKEKKSVSYYLTIVTRVFYDRPIIICFLPFQCAFGAMSSYILYYLFGIVVSQSDSLGPSYVGSLSALITIVGALVAIPCHWIIMNLASGRPVILAVGGVALTLVATAMLLLPVSTLGTWSYIVPLLSIYGLGRSVWENTNKAIIADFFSDREQNVAANAAVALFVGVSGGASYFCFPSVSSASASTAMVILSSTAFVSYVFGLCLNSVVYKDDTCTTSSTSNS